MLGGIRNKRILRCMRALEEETKRPSGQDLRERLNNVQRKGQEHSLGAIRLECSDNCARHILDLERRDQKLVSSRRHASPSHLGFDLSENA